MITLQEVEKMSFNKVSQYPDAVQKRIRAITNETRRKMFPNPSDYKKGERLDEYHRVVVDKVYAYLQKKGY